MCQNQEGPLSAATYQEDVSVGDWAEHGRFRALFLVVTFPNNCHNAYFVTFVWQTPMKHNVHKSLH